MNKVKKDDIGLYIGAIPAKYCDRLIREFHKGFAFGEVIEGVVSSDSVEAYKSDDFLVAKDIHMADHERWDDFNCDLHQNYVIPALEDYLSDYKNVIGSESRVDPRSCIMSLYERGKGHFCPHQDHVQGANRSLTIICYLNNVISGGTTYFFNQEYRVQPATGNIIIFPSNFVYSHLGSMPLSGDKYITVSFCSVEVGDEKKLKALEAMKA